MKRYTRYKNNNDSTFTVLEKSEETNRFYKPNKNCPARFKKLFYESLYRNEDKYVKASKGE